MPFILVTPGFLLLVLLPPKPGHRSKVLRTQMYHQPKQGPAQYARDFPENDTETGVDEKRRAYYSENEIKSEGIVEARGGLEIV